MVLSLTAGLPVISDVLREKVKANLVISNRDAKLDLIHHYRSEFPKWSAQVRSGFNLCLFGLGSKKAMLEEFVNDFMFDMPRLVFNGTSSMISLKKILQTIFSCVLKLKKIPSSSTLSLHEGATHITSGFLRWISYIGSSLASQLCIVIHNIDSKWLKSSSTQLCLSALAALGKVSMIVSVDDINAFKLWDHSILASSCYLFVECTTFMPYWFELSTAQEKNSSTNSAKRVKYIWPTLTPNIKSALLLLKKPMRFEDWYGKCLDAMLVSNEGAFSGYIQEMKDHDLVEEQGGMLKLNFSVDLIEMDNDD